MSENVVTYQLPEGALRVITEHYPAHLVPPHEPQPVRYSFYLDDVPVTRDEARQLVDAELARRKA